MLKKILFISIFLLILMGYVAAFEVPEGFEGVPGIGRYSNTDDENSGQVIEVYDDDVFNRVFESKFGEEYTWDNNRDGTFDFEYDDGIDEYSGIGKDYYINDHHYVVLFWNKDVNDNDGILKELIAECDEINKDIEY